MDTEDRQLIAKIVIAVIVLLAALAAVCMFYIRF